MNLIDRFHHWRRKIRWNKQYKKGRWENLKNELEALRYQKIIDFIKKYAIKSPSILDLGCGDGVLTLRMQAEDYSFFKGIDFSSVSIEKAKAYFFPNSSFEAYDILYYTPDQKYDCIIFNEAFYYIPDKEKTRVLNHILSFLQKDGVLITSIFREGTGCWEYFTDDKKLKQLDFTRVNTTKETTYWKIGVYQLKNG